MISGRFGSAETMSSLGELESHQDVPISWEQLLLSLRHPHSQAFLSLEERTRMPSSAGKGKNGEQGAADGSAELLPAISCWENPSISLAQGEEPPAAGATSCGAHLAAGKGGTSLSKKTPAIILISRTKHLFGEWSCSEGLQLGQGSHLGMGIGATVG